MGPGCGTILYTFSVCTLSFEEPLTWRSQNPLRTLREGKTGCDAFESAPSRKRVGLLCFHLLFKTENLKERVHMHPRLTKAMAVAAALVITLFPADPVSAQDKYHFSTTTTLKPSV